MDTKFDEIMKRVNSMKGQKVDQFEMFAREVVLECARVCEQLKFTAAGPSSAAAYQRTLCAKAIKEHFGVH